MVKLKVRNDGSYDVLLGELDKSAGRIVFDLGKYFYMPPDCQGALMLSVWFLQEIIKKIDFLEMTAPEGLH